MTLSLIVDGYRAAKIGTTLHMDICIVVVALALAVCRGDYLSSRNEIRCMDRTRFLGDLLEVELLQ